MAIIPVEVCQKKEKREGKTQKPASQSMDVLMNKRTALVKGTLPGKSHSLKKTQTGLAGGRGESQRDQDLPRKGT